MKKPRLFICGDSWTDWIRPEVGLHWIDYLESHYEVIRLGLMNMDNTSIIHQIGQIPDYKLGDRIIVVFTEPQRVQRRYYIKELKKLDSWLDYDLKKWSIRDENMVHQEWIEMQLWDNNMRGDEIDFYRKMKMLLKDYKPIFLTWSLHFHKLTKDFVDLVKVTSLDHEGIFKDDEHPGINGCFEMYKMVLYRLDPMIKNIDFKGDKQII